MTTVQQLVASPLVGDSVSDATHRRPRRLGD